MYLIYFSHEFIHIALILLALILHSFLVVADDRAVQPLPRVPGGQRIRMPALAQVVLVLVDDERPPDDGELPLKQGDLGCCEMKRAVPFFCRGDIAEIPRMRVNPRARTVLRIGGIEMPAAVGAVAAQQVAELVHVESVLSRRQVFNVPRHLYR